MTRTVVVLLLAVATAGAAQDAGEDALGSGLKLVLRLYDECSRRDAGLGACLKAKAVGFFDRAMRLREIPLAESLSLVRTAAHEGDARGAAPLLSEAQLAALSADETDDLLLQRAARFLNTHKVQLDLPRVSDQAVEEGRGKMKKMMGMMMMGVAMKMAGLIPIAIAGLFLLAGKALIVSKVALVLILVIALKKILAQKQMGGGGGHHDAGHGWQGGGDRRSLDAHHMAYRGHLPS